MKTFWKFALVCAMLMMATVGWASIPREGLGNASEGVDTPASPDAVKLDPARSDRSPLDLTAINNGTFGGAPYARDDAAAVNHYKAQATSIGAGGYTSDIDYRTLESAIISFDNHSTYVTDRGGCIYIQTVLTGLVAGDIIEVDNNYFYDDGTGYASFWDQVPYWLLVSTYTHNPVNTINNWLIYVEEVSPGNYTAVIGSGEYNLALNTDDMTTVIGDKFKLTREVRVWQGAALVSPLVSGRGYTYSSVGITGGTQIGSNSLDTGDLTIVGCDPVWIDDDWSANSNGDVVSGHTFGQDAFAILQQSIYGVSGSTVNVGPGVYHERLVLTSNLDLRGAQYGVDPTPSGARTNPANESIVDLAGVPLSNPNVLMDMAPGVNNVSISGFTLNGSQVFHWADEAVIRAQGCTGITVQDNIVDGYYGVVAQGAANNLTVQRNRVTVNKTGFVIQNSSNLAGFIGNTLAVGSSPAADCQAIYITGTSNCSVTGNAATGFANGGNLNGSNNTQLLVSGNTFTGGKKGVNLWGSTTFVTISGNTITGSVEHGINVKGANITMTGNTITGNTLDGILVDYHTIPTTAIAIHNNTITGNGNKALEVTPAVVQTVDAEQNYWGTTDYCSLPPLISGLADYDPWCNSDFTTCTYTAATSTTVHNVTQGTHFCSLTAALTAANPYDEIHADAGVVFHEHAIPIDEPVTLIGVPGDANPGTGPNPPVVNGDNNHYGFEFLDGAHDVIISGFEFTNFGASSSTGWGVPIFAWDVNTYNVTIADNYMHHIEGNGVLVGSDYADQHSNWTITRNRLTDYGWVPSQDEAYGLELTNCSNGVISNNEIDAGSRIPGMAIRVSGRIADMHNVDVLNNYVRGAFVRCAIQVNAYDFEVTGAHLDDVRIEGNDIEISGAPRVVYLRDDVNGSAILSNVVIYDNKLVSLDNQLAVESLTDQTMNASGNWWGDNTPAGLATKMVGPVDYTPWLNSGTDTGDPGFQGDFSVLNVGDGGQQTGVVGRIQEGINSVSGSTVYVMPGTYFEHDISVTGPVSIIGDPGDAQPGPGANAPIVDGQNTWQYGFKLLNGASNVTISGFEIRNYVGPLTGDGDAVVAWVDGTDHITVTDNYMHDLDWNGVLVGNDNGIAGHSYWTVARNVLEDFGPAAFATAGYGLELSNTSHGVIEDNIIDAGSRFPGVAILVYFRGPTGEDMVIQRNQIRGAYDFAGINVQSSAEDASPGTFDDVQILNNDVEISGAGIPAVQIRNKLGGVVTNSTIFENRLINNDGFGAKNLTAQTLNASGNWWGDITPAGVAAKMSGTVDYTPWLGGGTDTNPGFDGNFSTLYLDDDSPQTGAVARIQEGINSVSGSTVNVMPGTYAENVNVNQVITLNGSGSGSNPAFDTIIDPVSGTGIIVSVSGASAVNRVVIQNLRVTGAGNGVDINASNASYLTFNNVACVSNTAYGINTNPPVGFGSFADIILTGCDLSSNGSTGLRTASYVGVNGLAITGGGMNGNQFGFYTTSSVGSPLVTNVTVNGTTFNNNTSKGMYFENLDNATFTGITVNNSGTTGGHAAGVDLNLKYHSFFDIFFVNPTITNCGNGDVVNGAGMMLKARDDGGYSGNPASLNTVNITGGTFSGNLEAIRLGEIAPANNAGPTDVSINNCSITGSTLKELRNRTQATTDAECNWWGSLNYLTIQSEVEGLVDFDPWNNSTLTSCTYTYVGPTDVVLELPDNYFGCDPACEDELLKVKFGLADFRGGHLVIQLPAGFVADWSADPAFLNATPTSDPAAFLNSSWAGGGGTSVITLDVTWGDLVPPSDPSQGDGDKYIAFLPITHTGTGDDGTYAPTITAYDFWDINNVHYDGTPSLTFTLPNLYVDCTAPTVTLIGGAGEGLCAGYNDAAAFEEELAMTFVNTGAPASTPLTAQIVMTRPDLSTVNYPISPVADGDWPPAAVWADMTLQGCYTFSLTATDATCNTSTPAPVSVIKDTQAPVFSPASYFTQDGPCYNDIDGDPNNGEAQLDSDLNMNVTPPTACETSGYTLMLNMGVNNHTPISGATISGYPDATQAGALWTFITDNTADDYSGNVTVNWSLKDCLGNETTGSFTFCVDFAPPTNSFSAFDARPAHLGVWLSWNWTYHAVEAVEMKIYRSATTTDYPTYTPARTYYAGAYPPPLADWVEIANQVGPNTTPALYDKPSYTDDYHPNVSPTHWLDYDAAWTDATPARDIYRYITFVKDVAGNWSDAGTAVTQLDHSTNYWLGDFDPYHTGAGIGTSEGRVNIQDLTTLSVNYFQTVPPAASYCSINDDGNYENAPGKGIPDPDLIINFLDLVVFSFNYGMVSPVGVNEGTEFSIPPSPTAPRFDQLDAQPVITMTCDGDDDIEWGDEFTVVVSLSGNDAGVLKTAEAEITFDPEVIEFKSASETQIGITGDGVLFSKAAQMTGKSDDKVGLVAGACGAAMLDGSGTLGTITFRWISERVGEANLGLLTRLADGSGAIIEYEGSTLTIGATGVIPLDYALHQNYPNPFNPSTTIRFDLPDDANVRLVIYNVMGQEVRTLVSGVTPAGIHSIIWDGTSNEGRDVGSGLYIYRISANDFSATHKMLLTR